MWPLPIVLTDSAASEEGSISSAMSLGQGIDIPGIRTSSEGHFRKSNNKWERPVEPISPPVPRDTLASDTITYHLLGMPLNPLGLPPYGCKFGYFPLPRLRMELGNPVFFQPLTI
jgi:hypothetical protein